MRKILLALVLLAGVSASGYAQASRQLNLTTTDKIGPAAAPWINEIGSGINNHQIVWTTDGTVTTCSVKVEKSSDGVSWSDLITGATCTSNGASSLTSGIANYVRVNATTLTGSGTLRVRYLGFIPGQPVTATVDTTGLATGVAQGSTTSGELGTLVQCAVTTSAPTYTTAQTNPLSCDTSGGLRVSGGGGGTQYTQDAALTVASTVMTMAGGRASAAVPTDVSADNDAVIPWYLRSGAQAVQLTNAGVLTLSGSGTSTGALRVELPTNGTGVIAQVTLIPSVTTVTTVTTVASVTAVGTITPGNGTTNLGKAIDQSAGSTDVGVMALAIRDDALTTLTPIDGDYVPLRTNSTGALWVQSSIIDAAEGAAVATNPVPMGCVYRTSYTALDAGDVGYPICDVSSRLMTVPTPGIQGGWTSLNATAADGATPCTSTVQAIKASQGTFGGYFLNNPNTADSWVQIYNVASGSVTVGTTNPALTFRLPGTASNSVAANLEISLGVQFSTAMSVACTTTAGGNGNPANALEGDFWYK